jgi:hypothetical protein
MGNHTARKGGEAMAQGTSKLKATPQVFQALNQFKYEVASELGINPEYKTGYWGNITSRECGAVGGHMVRRMIALAEQELLGTQRPTGFRNP